MGFFNNKEQEQEQDVYVVELECSNCGIVEEYEIPCGITVEEFSKSNKCSNCECNSELTLYEI